MELVRNHDSGYWDLYVGTEPEPIRFCSTASREMGEVIAGFLRDHILVKGNAEVSDTVWEEHGFYYAVERYERAIIMQALARTEGNKKQAAALLKMNRTTLVEKARNYGLEAAELLRSAPKERRSTG